MLGLAVYREFGPAADPGVVFFLGQGLLEVSGGGPALRGPGHDRLQVRDVRAKPAAWPRLAPASCAAAKNPGA